MLNNIIYRQRISLLRDMMLHHSIDVYMVPSSDTNLLEDASNYALARQWFSGFTGSSGLLVVTCSTAALFVDSRYWQQAEYELLGTDIELIKIKSKDGVELIDWLIKYFIQNAQKNPIIGLPAGMVSVATFFDYKQRLDNYRVRFNVQDDLLSEFLKAGYGFPKKLIQVYPLSFAVIGRRKKLDLIAEEIKKLGAHFHLISSFDDIAWILNLRGNDLPYIPVFFSYLIITMYGVAHLFVEQDKLSSELVKVLQADGVFLHDYDTINKFVESVSLNEYLLFDSMRTNVLVMLRLGYFDKMESFFEKRLFLSYSNQPDIALSLGIIDRPNPSVLLKARKMPGEVQNIRNAMRKDGIALIEFFADLDCDLAKNTILSEIDVAQKLVKFQSYQANYWGSSFSPIVAFKENAALPHYAATKTKSSLIQGHGLLLIDVGAQYLDGTTDITRMVPVGDISIQEKWDCTLVLKGLIALTCTKFPAGIKAPMLDVIARGPLWSACLDYGHGTGHGVGCFLNVHESSHSISYRADGKYQVGLQKGMINSIEPGIYRSKKWGVRFENLVVTQEYAVSDFGDFLEFHTLTLVPIDTRCLLIEMLTTEELKWLNCYHARIADLIRSSLSQQAKKWLDVMTKPL